MVVERAVSSARSCSADLVPLSPAQRHSAAPAAEWPYFLRRRVEVVSWRRDSAEERFAIEVARSRRRRAVEVSTASRSGSVRVWVWDWDWAFWRRWVVER